jgi:MFS family permease
VSRIVLVFQRMSGQVEAFRGRISRPPATLQVTAEEWRNSNLYTFEGPISGLVGALAASLVTLFAIQLGASNSMVGWITSGPALVSLFWLIPSGRLIQRWGDYSRALAVAMAGNRMTLLALAAVPFLPADWRAPAVVVIMTLAAFPNGMWGPSTMSAAGEMFAPENLAKLLSRRWVAYYVSSVIFTPLGGALIDLIRFPVNFQVIFAALGLVGFSSLWFILRLRLPQRDWAHNPAIAAPPAGALRWRALTRYRSVILFEIGILVTYFAWFAAAPVYPIYWVRDLGASGLWIGLLAAGQSVGAAIGSAVWGRWSRPHRDRRNVMWIIWGGMALYPILSAAFPFLTPQLLFVVWAGACVAGGDVLLFNRMYQIFPRGERPTLFSFHQVILNVAAFVGPLVSTMLVDQVGPRPVLAMISVIGLAGGVLIYWFGWRAGQADGGAPEPAKAT